MKNLTGYAGMTLTFGGVTLMALDPSHARWAFPIFIASALAWLVNGVLSRNSPQVITQTALAILNSIAVIRWFT